MAGNSQRQGAMRKPDAKKSRTVGSGGNRRQKLEGKGPTPKASERTGHVAKKRKDAAERVAEKESRRGRGKGRPGRGSNDEIVAGRNQVVEALVPISRRSRCTFNVRSILDPRIREGNAQGA